MENIKTKQINKYKKNKLIDTQNILVVARGGEIGGKRNG